MNLPILRTILGILCSATVYSSAIVQGASNVEEANAAVSRFAVEFQKIEAAETAELVPVEATFVREVERLRENVRAQGDLAAVLDAEAVLEALRSSKAIPIPKVLGAKIQQLQAAYERSKAQVLSRYAPARTRLEAEYNLAMSEMEQRFTRNGDFDAATHVREARLSAPVRVAVDILPLMVGERQSREGSAMVERGTKLRTESAFQTPLEIEYVLKTDQQVRFGYACSQMIFNWEGNGNELRLDGGPADGQHRSGAGGIPKNRYVTIKQVVLQDQMIVSVDGKERARWKGDFSRVNEEILLWPVGSSTLWVKRITLRRLPQRE